jgi:hypothetical protein
MQAVKFTLSGSYKDAEGKLRNYDGIKCIVPTSEEDVAYLHVRGRYLPTKIINDKRYEYSPERVREVFVDDVEKIDAEFSFFGKDVKEMSQDELQDMASYYDLRRIPLPRGAGLREMRFIAYQQYMSEILKTPLPRDVTASALNELDPLVVKKPTASRKSAPKVLSLQELLDIEKSKSGDDNLTLEQLKGIAKKHNISHSPNIGYDALYAKLFNS